MSRTRSRVTEHPRVAYTGGFTVQGTTQHGFPNVTVPAPLPTLSMGSKTETITDVVTPHFRKRIQNGEIISNPFKRTVVENFTSSPGQYVHEYYKLNGLYCQQHVPPQYHNLHTKWFGEWRQGHPGVLTYDAVSRAARRQAVIDQAVLQANANIDTSEMLALATIAESGKTVDSMRAILWRLYKILKNVRRLNVAGVMKELSPKELADRYMEARYAIRPLLYDVRGIVRSLEKGNRSTRRTFRGSASDSYSTSDTVTNVPIGLYLVDGCFFRTLEYNVSARAGVLCDIDITQLSTFGLDQIAETAWELAPFSFIADWFVGVGDWIAAHTPNAGVRQLASFVTVRETLTATTTATSHRSLASTAGFVTVSLSLPPFYTRNEELVLERLVNPVVSTVPLVNLKLDVFKLTDLGIIIRNLMK